MRKLSETLELQLVTSNQNTSIVLDNMCAEWQRCPYPQLSVLLVHLKYLAMVHQNHHWVAKGDAFYGDHLLYQRLYEGATGEIDQVAEKVVGVGTHENVDLYLQISQLNRLIQGYGSTQTIPQQTELAKRSLLAEMNFLVVTSKLVESMKELGLLTRGIDNMIAGIEDAHEGAIYLLKQRCTSSMF